MLTKSVFKAGDMVTPLRNIEFIDSTIHRKGSIYLILPGEESYYNLFAKDYKQVGWERDITVETTRRKRG